LKCDPRLSEHLAVAFEAHQHRDLHAGTRLIDRRCPRPATTGSRANSSPASKPTWNFSGQRAGLASACPARSAIRLSSASLTTVGAGGVRAESEARMFATLRGRLGAIVKPGAVA
jgi:hypothetical protein